MTGNGLSKILNRSFSRDKHRVKVFENRVLRRMFEPKMDEVVGGLEKMA
jgi:hypothetical protein